jgi:CDP-diacylglycerol--serine O-phosphatidyltransferase
MVTNAPFYSFKAMSSRRSVPFTAIVLIVILIAIVNLHPSLVLFWLSVIYGLSGYVSYGWRKAKGLPTSVISVSTDEPEEQGLHR